MTVEYHLGKGCTERGYHHPRILGSIAPLPSRVALVPIPWIPDAMLGGGRGVTQGNTCLPALRSQLSA